MKTVVLFGIEYSIKYSIRQFFIFEHLTKQRFEGKTLLNDYMLFYCNILANNPACLIDFKQFLEAVELDKSLYATFSELMLQWANVNGQFEGEKKKS